MGLPQKTTATLLLLSGVSLFSKNIFKEEFLSPEYKKRTAYEHRIPEKKKNGNFSEFKAPPGLEAAVDVWFQLYDKYPFNKIILFDDDFNIHAIHESITRDEYDQLSSWGKKKNIREINKIRDSVKKKTGKEIRWRRGAVDNLQTKNFQLYLNPCRKELADISVNPEFASIWLLEASGHILIISRAGARGPYQFTNFTATEDCGILIDNSFFGILDPMIGAKNMGIELIVYEKRHGFPLLAPNIYHSGIRNVDRAIYFTKQSSKKLGLEGILSEENMFTYISMDFPDQPKEIRGTYGISSSQYVPSIFAVKKIVKKRFPPDLLRTWQIEYDEIELHYKDSGKKIDINELIKEMGFSEKKMLDLNPAILYLQKTNGDTKALKRVIGQYRFNRITPNLSEGTTLRVPLGFGDKFLETYGGLLSKQEIKKYTKDDSLEVCEKPPSSLGDMLYQEIVDMRKELKHADVSLNSLKKVRRAYVRDMLTHPENNYFNVMIEVVNRDMRRTLREKEQRYWEKMAKWQEKVDKIAVKELPDLQKYFERKN